MPRNKQAKPIDGDQSMFDGNGQPTAAAIAAPPRPKPKRRNTPDPDARPRRGRGKVIGWYEICGARCISGHKNTIWVHGSSDDDACGTFRVSKLFRKGDDSPVPTGAFKRELGTGEYGIIRCGPHETREVNWRNESKVIEEERKRRRQNAAKRAERARKKQLQAA